MRAGLRPACALFLKMVSMYADVYMCVCVCVSVCLSLCVSALRLLITSGIMWRDMDPYNWLNKSYSYYMAIVVIIVNGRGLGIDTLCGN